LSRVDAEDVEEEDCEDIGRREVAARMSQAGAMDHGEAGAANGSGQPREVDRRADDGGRLKLHIYA
jgi:hypothetical protein